MRLAAGGEALLHFFLGHRARNGDTELNPRPHRHGGASELDFREKKDATIAEMAVRPEEDQ